jgi:hypothetical protein
MERKLVPLMVSVCAVAPAVAEVGERLVIAGTELLTMKFTAFEAPPPGGGLVTITGYDPAVARSLVLREMAS